MNKHIMQNVKLRIHPYTGNVSKRDRYKIKTFLYDKKIETKSTWVDRISACLDPLFNTEYGCFSKNNNKKISCMVNAFPQVLSCLYFGKSDVNYCIPDDSPLPCKGECGYSQDEVEKLYGCVNSYGEVTNDCNVYEKDFCDCSKAGKTWNGLKNACECEEGKIDYGECCSTKVCNTEHHEQMDCKTDTCVCESGYTRLPIIPPDHPNSAYSGQCAASCGTGSDQNNPINYEGSDGKAGCGPALGKNGDMCCDDGKCVLDNGKWDGKYSYNPQTKSECLSTYGVWRITNYDTCPREGHCEYPMCTDPVQILDQFQPDGPAWTFKCESCEAPSTSPPPPQCETACKSFCSSNAAFPKYEKSYCGPTGTNQDTCICHCTD